MDEVMAIVAVKDQLDDVNHQRELVIGKLHRLAKAWVEGYYPEAQYEQQKRRLELELESLVIPELNAAEEAGNLIPNLPGLWQDADLGERREILLAMLDAVYVDTKESKQIVAILPMPAFQPVFQVATTREDSGVILIQEPLQSINETETADLCSWWRRGRTCRVQTENRVWRKKGNRNLDANYVVRTNCRTVNQKPQELLSFAKCHFFQTRSYGFAEGFEVF